MTKVLVVYHSIWGHIERMAQAQAEGVREVPGAVAQVKRVAETMSDEALAAIGAKRDQAAPVARPDELADYDAVIFGTPTRFGNMTGQMRTFLDQTGALWARGALVGKAGSVFTSSGTQHGGQESTILSFHLTLLHHGMVIVGLPYSEAALSSTRSGGTPYGASHVAGAEGNPALSDEERELAFAQGRRLAAIAMKLGAR